MTPPTGELIDIHAHFLTEHYVHEARAAGHTEPDGMPGWPTWKSATHLSLMDHHHITRSLLSISSPGVHFGGDVAARELARHVNDTAAVITRAHPDRFGFLAALPLPDIDGTLMEIQRVFDDLGADGVSILTHSRGVYLSDPYLEPVLSALNDRHAVVLLHPTSPPASAAPPRPLPAPVLEFIFDTTRTVTDLVRAGSLRRYPLLRLVIPHGGAALPLLADRIQAFQTRLPRNPVESEAPPFPDQLRQLWYDTAGAPFPQQIPALVQLVGSERIVYGSDYCWTPRSGVDTQVDSLRHAPAPAGSQSWAALTTHNARRLLNRE